jgi:aminoglycoside 3-N-acetyltransferase
MDVTKQNLIDGFRRLGLRPGMRLIVHASLRSFGRVEGGAQTVIVALQELITPAGTLMMPSFNHGSIFESGGSGVYDPLNSPTTNGAIPQLFWQSPDVFRSLNPTHAFACWGDHARQYLENHHRTLTLGPNSPLGLLARDGGYGLLLGVGYEANTLHHVAEYVNGAPCLGYRSRVYPVKLPDGGIVEGRTWSYRSAKCPINDTARYAQLMKDKGLERTTTIGNSLITLFKLQECQDLILELLKGGIDDSPPCHRCPIRPNFKEPYISSDWDPTTNSLLPTSVSWSY